MHREELLLNPIAFMPPPQVLDGLSPEDAARRIPGVTHSIVEILAHLVFWQTWFIEPLQRRGDPPAASAAEGWPAATAADWEPLREQFLAGLHRALELPADGRIDPPIEFPPLANYTIADAMTHLGQHNAHHLGTNRDSASGARRMAAAGRKLHLVDAVARAVGAASVIAGAIASVSGFGIGSLLTPLLMLWMPTAEAVAILAIPHALATAIRWVRFAPLSTGRRSASSESPVPRAAWRAPRFSLSSRAPS